MEKSGRIAREQRTVEIMVRIFCRRHHHGAAEGLCAECRETLEYAVARLERCPHGAQKPTCARCPIHCYSPAMRERIVRVMRYAGPRLMLRHPIMAIQHAMKVRIKK